MYCAAALGQSEIQKLDTLLCHQDIRGLEVAMRDALAVRNVQSVEDLSRGTPVIFKYAADSAGRRGSRRSLREVEEGTTG
jgi:hypothetical protein